MRDRRFRIIALGVAPVVLLGFAFVQLLGVPWWMGSPAWVTALAVEALVLWQVADPAAATTARARRVGFGLLQSVVTACVVGGVLLMVALMLILGHDG